MPSTKQPSVYDRVCQILESARIRAARSVNTAQVVAHWLVGREIVEEEQKGEGRASYGKKLVERLSARITKDFGPGYSAQNLFYMKQFYLTYATLLEPDQILHAARGESSESGGSNVGDLHGGPPKSFGVAVNALWIRCGIFKMKHAGRAR
jgi:hypothetical protein